jgi:DNA-directed RNA polymerase specialized sigma24 family protein
MTPLPVRRDLTNDILALHDTVMGMAVNRMGMDCYHAAQDVAQDTVSRVILKQAFIDVQDAGTVRAYTLRAADNAIIDYYRANHGPSGNGLRETPTGLRGEFLKSPGDVEAGGYLSTSSLPTALGELQHEERAEWVRSRAARLPKEQRLAILALLEGHSMADYGKRTGRGGSTTRVLVKRAKAGLAVLLDREGVRDDLCE